ncbi:BSD domain-containing protein 1-like protein [Cinnamomum micranthum f. kanehirae]|uniref:BSD domain-containing protein 1-like protein n=1 Tax=Cinnamomum micranthum f. kanehirae TaxID=337451 RepID=A0A443PSF1_9MAGN|nr:BSD domain-containing protein 1-like protein [Cinnamomum micranthum f. kanehirae]
MDFFKSVFADDSSPQNPQNPYDSDPDSPNHPSQDEEELEENPDPNPNSSAAWSFGGLIKTLATRSELRSVIDTYRRDLDEFRSGLSKETAAICDAASRAVKDLPGSLETGASVAQESLESVGQAIDDFSSSVWRGTAEIISHGKDALLSADLDDGGDSETLNSGSAAVASQSSKRYSRFEVQVAGIQSDPVTYCDEPEDAEDYGKWKLGFVLEEKEEEIENLCSENGTVETIYGKLVPSVVDHETFWSRYFYRIYKLKLVEDARANLVKRAISREDDEDLSWDVEDDDEEEEEEPLKVSKNRILQEEIPTVKPIEVGEENSNKRSDDLGFSTEPAFDHGSVEGLKSVEKQEIVESDSENGDNSAAKPDEKSSMDGKMDTGESGKDSDISVVSSQQSGHEDEDLGWDEIEDLSSIDDKKVTTAASSNKDDMRKRLSTADDEEDLSWDIEDEESGIGELYHDVI